jgi:hypothetical protein
VRSYCRGIVVRAVPSETRVKLFERLRVKEMASLRSFLDPPVAKGKTIKGSGQVGYHLHTRNHTSILVLDGSELHGQVILISIPILYYVFAIVSRVLLYITCTNKCPFFVITYHYTYVHTRISVIVDQIHERAPGAAPN